MLMNLNAESEPVKNYRLQLIGVIAGGSLLLIILSSIMSVNNTQEVEMKIGDAGLIKSLGKNLFENYVLPFEISSVLFLSAMIGAVVIGKKEESADHHPVK
jgi:NADH-quinone oxidoreductase subunit J